MEPLPARDLKSDLKSDAASQEEMMEESDVEVDEDLDGHMTAAVPAVSVSSYEDIEERDSRNKAGGRGKTQNSNNDHNLKERHRRKILKEAVTDLRKQLRKPTRKPVTIKVLEAAQEEIKDLKALEKTSMERLETLKKRHSHLQWKLDELIKEVDKLPERDSVPQLHADSCSAVAFPSQQLTAPQTPPTVPIPAAYIIAPFSLSPQQQQQHAQSLVNVPMAPSATLLQPRLPIPNPSFLPAPFFPHLPAVPSMQPSAQQTSFPGLQTLTSIASNSRLHPMLLSSSSTGLTNSYLIPPPPASFLTQPYLRPTPPMGMPGFLGQRTFSSLLTPDCLYNKPGTFSVPTVDVSKESAYPASLSAGTSLRRTTSAGAVTSQSSTSLGSENCTTVLDRLHPNSSHPAPQVAARANRRTTSSEGDGCVPMMTHQHRSLPGFTPLSRNVNEKSTLTVDVAVNDSDEDKSVYSNVEGTSVSASQSLPDEEEEETDVSENYIWRRKKKRRKRRNREGFPSSSDSESEGSCSSSQRGRIRSGRMRNSSSRSSASGSDASRKGGCGGKSKSKKCPSFTVNKLCCVPPLLKVSAVEINCPFPDDPRKSGSSNLELISECEITVTANTSYVPTSSPPSRIPPCPTLDHLPEVENKDSGNSSMTNSPESSTPSSEDSVNWTEAIIEKSMDNLKRKFSECHSNYFKNGRKCSSNNSNSSCPTNTSYPILLNT